MFSTANLKVHVKVLPLANTQMNHGKFFSPTSGYFVGKTLSSAGNLVGFVMSIDQSKNTLGSSIPASFTDLDGYLLFTNEGTIVDLSSFVSIATGPIFTLQDAVLSSSTLKSGSSTLNPSSSLEVGVSSDMIDYTYTLSTTAD